MFKPKDYPWQHKTYLAKKILKQFKEQFQNQEHSLLTTQKGTCSIFLSGIYYLSTTNPPMP